jgi:hypothetical protein
VNNNKSLATENILLILLKVYRAQLQCCHQSYDLCNGKEIDSINNPLVYYFELLCNTRIYCHEAPSSLSYKWLKKRATHSTDPDLLLEMKNVEREIQLADSRLSNGSKRK